MHTAACGRCQGGAVVVDGVAAGRSSLLRGVVDATAGGEVGRTPRRPRRDPAGSRDARTACPAARCCAGPPTRRGPTPGTGAAAPAWAAPPEGAARRRGAEVLLAQPEVGEAASSPSSSGGGPVVAPRRTIRRRADAVAQSSSSPARAISGQLRRHRRAHRGRRTLLRPMPRRGRKCWSFVASVRPRGPVGPVEVAGACPAALRAACAAAEARRQESRLVRAGVIAAAHSRPSSRPQRDLTGTGSAGALDVEGGRAQLRAGRPAPP